MDIRGEWRIVALAAVAALSVTAPMAATVAAPIVATLVFLASRPFSFRFDVPSALAVAIPALSALSTLWSVNVGVSRSATITCAALAAYFVVARYVTKTRSQLLILASGYLLGCVLLIGRLVHLRVTTPLSERLNLPDVNANYAGYALVAGFGVLVLIWAAAPQSRPLLFSLLGLAVLFGAGILLAGSRGSFVGLALLALWLLIARPLRKPPLWIFVVLVGAAAVALATGIADRLSLPLEYLLGRPTGDWSGRLLIWPIAREWWLEHFLIGSGASTLAVSNPMGIGAHNLVLELGSGQGIVGVALFLAFLWFVFFKQPPLLVGCFIAVSVASYLTGHWDLAPAAWVVLALFSRSKLTVEDPDLASERSNSRTATVE